MDEIEHAIKGKIDGWRIERDFAYAIVLSSGRFKKAPDKLAMFPLPYDDEIESGFSEDDMVELYNNYQPYL